LEGGLEPARGFRPAILGVTLVLMGRICRLATVLCALCAVATAEKRPMTPLDVVKLRRLGAYAASPDGRWLLYAQSIPNWEKGQNFTDLFLVEVRSRGHRQMTFTSEADETPFAWARDSASFAFLSARDGGKAKQLYLLPVAGGEARRLTSEKEGVAGFAFSRDGRWIACTGGPEAHRTLKLIDLSHPAFPVKELLKHDTPIEEWLWHPDSSRIYFTAAGRDESVHARRHKLGFDVKINALESSPRNIHSIEIASANKRRLTSEEAFGFSQLRISRDGRRLACTGKPTRRYATSWDEEVFLLELDTGLLRRLTDNKQSEGNVQFSPDSNWVAFTLSEGAEELRPTRLHLVSTRGPERRILFDGWDYDGGLSFFAPSGDAIYFAATVGVNRQAWRMPAAGGQPEVLTRGDQFLNLSLDPDSGLLLISRSTPVQPEEIFTAPLAELSDPERWTRLTRLSEQIEEFSLGAYETIRWRASDGIEVEGLLVKPVNYEAGRRYPLIVQVHGGPAGTSTNSFGGTYSTYPHVFAGRGYAVFQPNYRGSSGYGERFRRQIAGDYFRQGFDDIMTGVDYLIARNIAEPRKLGHMGWSAGGHWSNWALTHTERFQAISSGAGAVNWISMYAQTDVQPVREFYFLGTPYDNWEHYRDVSPLTYIRNARTPTLIMCGTDDPRVPNPQSRELYIALQKLGIPVEYIEFPGMPHGLTKPRYQYVKMAAELAWFDKWIHGKPGWIDWEKVLDTLPPEVRATAP
jgi:dipeptidyl aminopeptidase/acylaminoacyl peptidase